jgi:hypothetical protein
MKEHFLAKLEGRRDAGECTEAIVQQATEA